MASRQGKKLRACALNTFLFTASCVLALLIGELIIRSFWPQSLILRRPDVWYPVERFGWQRSANLNTTVNFGGAGPVRLITDSEGNRIGASGRVQAPDIRILALGDSFLEALQVEYEKTMTWILQESITERTGLRTEVQCAGVGGWGPNQYLLQSKARLTDQHYDLQLVFFYLGNDVVKAKVDSYPPRHPAPYHTFRLPRQFSQREIVDAFFYPINDWLETKSHAFILFRNRMQPFLARLGLTALSLPFNIYRSAASKNWWDVTADICQEIERIGSEHGIPTLFVLIPPAYFFIDEPLKALGYDPETMDLTQPYRIMKPKLLEQGLYVIDLMPSFQKQHARGISCYGTVDSHFNAHGHRTAAQAILPHVLEVLSTGHTNPISSIPRYIP